MQKMITKMLLAALAGWIVSANAFHKANVPTINQITFGYYNHEIADARPIQRSQSQVDSGGIGMFDHEVYQYGQHFSILFGVSYSYWNRGHNSLQDIAIYPQLRFWAYRDMRISPYFMVSSGPSAMSTRTFHDDRLGSNYAFQDILGLCARVGAGSSRGLDICGKFQHYSNAGLALPNHGFDVPLLFSIGYDFKND